MHHKVRATGSYNFLQARIQIPSTINLDLLDKLCGDYWDWQLPLFLRFGFPLDFPQEARSKLISSNVNHASALQYPGDIKHYLETEIKHKAIVGPFHSPPFGDNTQVSPFMSRPKPDSTNRRVIIDLSWPKEASVNHFTLDNVYLNSVFKLQYPTIDTITEQLGKLGTSALIYKVDLSRAFCQLPIDPHDYNLLCLGWDKAYYCDLRCPFGEKIGSSLCSHLTDLFRYLAFQQGHITYTYVDDVIATSGPEYAELGFSFLKNLLEELNFPISPNKLVSPTHEATCLGIIINTRNQTLSVPQEKLQEILEKCREVINCTVVTKNKFQSLLGSLMYVHKCVKPTRVFTNRLLHSLRDSKDKKVIITLAIKKDISWFLNFLPRFNGTTTYVHTNPFRSHTIAIDACLKAVGGVWDNKVYTAPIPKIF